MGGHDAGEVASASIVEHLATLGIASSAPDLRARFEDRIVRANAEIWATRAVARRRRRSARRSRRCSTYRAAVRLHLVGRQPRLPGARRRARADCRATIPRCRNWSTAACITPEEARDLAAPQRHHAGGRRRARRSMTDMELGQIEPGDVFVLNTDGLTAHVSDGGDPRRGHRQRAGGGLRSPARHGAGARRHRQCDDRRREMPRATGIDADERDHRAGHGTRYAHMAG